MPTIRKEELKKSARRVAGAIRDPDLLISLLLDLLEFYRDRTRRSAQTTRSADASPAFEVPALVLSQLHHELQVALTALPDARMPVVRALWQAGYRETRQLAIDLVGVMEWPDAADYVESVAKDLADRGMAELLARRGLARWQAIGTEERLERLGGWLKGRDESLRILAMDALKQEVQIADVDDFPRYFSILQGLAGKRGRATGAQLREILNVLARRSPAETAQFLLDEFRGNNRKRAYRELAQDMVGAFPPAQRSRLERALSS